MHSGKEIEAFEKSLGKLTSAVFSDVKGVIIKAPLKGAKQQVFGFLPTKLTRISPFFPMSKRAMKARSFEELVWDNPWGKLTVQGKKLSVYDESVLLAVMTLVKKQRSRVIETTRHGLLKIMGVTAGRDTYKALWYALQRLTATNVTIEITEKKKMVRALTGNILSWVSISTDTAKFKLEVNPYFFEMFGHGLLTGLDLEFRASLTGDIAKATYRFLEGQRSGSYQCHLLTMARAINLNVDMELFRIRSRVRSGLRELRKKGYLIKWSLNHSDIIAVLKSQKSKV